MTQVAQPITPHQASEAYMKRPIPSEVIEAFNDLIVKGWNKSSGSVVYQEAVLSILEEKGFKRGDIFNNGWLDVEDHYRNVGWDVTYDKNLYAEKPKAYFVFRIKRSNVDPY